ncbi:uncharacterized protein LOC124145395 [Haliotis rufescens]|uniref:uncharacterized protein LOC124145395 n=1 Tax=Haliotis rufescens TaxID=6454 RepID=UPI00201F5187|nr:uncharacterized protein LOC124145395 [Haliotis rufescens]
MKVFHTSNLALFGFNLSYVLTLLTYNTDSCTNATFYRRLEMDDLMFAGSLIEEINLVDMRAECFSQCQWRVTCNMVLYNPLIRKCKLYTEAFDSSSDDSVETGWEYYGISCADFTLEYARTDVNVINTDPKDVCNTNIVASDDNTSSCYTGASWKVVPVKCVSCYIGMARQSMIPSMDYSEDLNFDLAAGMKLRLALSGDTTEYNQIVFEAPNTDRVYLLSLRWSSSPTRAVFNARQGGVYSREEEELGISVTDISNYVIEIHISESDFMTYADGILLMTNQMRLPVTGVRRVTVRGLTALHSFHIGYVLC